MLHPSHQYEEAWGPWDPWMGAEWGNDNLRKGEQEQPSSQGGPRTTQMDGNLARKHHVHMRIVSGMGWDGWIKRPGKLTQGKSSISISLRPTADRYLGNSAEAQAPCLSPGLHCTVPPYVQHSLGGSVLRELEKHIE